MATPERGWYPDPSGRHAYRWFDAGWTEHVNDDGIAGTDPLPHRTAPARPSATAARPRPFEGQAKKRDNDYPVGRWWVGAILFAALWLAAYKFANIVFI
jgi:hypothetical protein